MERVLMAPQHQESRTIPPDHASARQTEMGEKFNQVLFAALDALQEGKIPYALIGGIAVSGMGRPRSTHDIDVFVRPEDADAALEALGRHHFETERTDRRWLYKGWMDEMMVDIIFKSSGDLYFDNEMQTRAVIAHYHGRDIPTVSPEDLIIIKAAVHSEIGPHHWHDALALLSHATIDWEYLLRRARRAARRILALLVYAQSNDIWIPNSVITELYNTIFNDNQARSRSLADERRAPGGHMPPNPSANVGGPPPSSASSSAAPGGHTMSARTAVAPKAPPMPEKYVIGKIQNILATDERIAALDIDVIVGGQKVLVKGEVNSEEQKKKLEGVILEIAAGYQIDNQVRVVDMTAPTAEEVV